MASSQGGAPGDAPQPLEDRLRSLILNHGSSGEDIRLERGQPKSKLPPHMLNRAAIDQEEHLATHDISQAQAVPDVTVTQFKSKRPNQAQRRQRTSQPSLPIDSSPIPQDYRHSTAAWPSASGQNPSFSSEHVPGRPAWRATNDFQQHSQPQQYDQRHNQRSQNKVGGFSEAGNNLAHGSPYHGQRRQWQPANTMRNDAPITNRSIPTQHSEGRQSFRGRPDGNRLYHAGGHGPFEQRRDGGNSERIATQCAYLEHLVHDFVPRVQIEPAEIAEKEAFRVRVEQLCRDAIQHHERDVLGNENFDPLSIGLKCFGSMASGFGTKSSDMDLALLSPCSNPAVENFDSPVPRVLEKAFLQTGLGARLLTRTRVPIIKLCEVPTPKLASDLRKRRDDWEKGFSEDGPQPGTNQVRIETNEHKTETAQSDTTVFDLVDTVEATKAVPKATDPTEPAADRLKALTQSAETALCTYYDEAKKLLHKLGGRDMTTAHGHAMTEKQQGILVNVCKAFMKGLNDDFVRSKLQQYNSKQFEAQEAAVACRSLMSVYTQAEGETWTKAWSNRAVPEINDRLEQACWHQIELWQTLCDRSDMETVSYNKQLQSMLEKLHEISSLQLHHLQQASIEDPAQYVTRVRRIAKELGALPDSRYATAVVDHYISGIHGTPIKERLQTMVSETHTNLEEVARVHLAFDLATSYETAISAGTFDDADKNTVSQYVEILERTKFNNESPTAEVVDMLGNMLKLPDPTNHRTPRVKDRYYDPLSFPKDGVGIQSDINFSAQLALHNTDLLRCYSLTDPRVTPFILFIKAWAKRRGVNTPYRGTLSSYGYVLMALHYLVNIASPFVCPNLQLVKRDLHQRLSQDEDKSKVSCQGRDVSFWRNEREILQLSQRKLLNHNKDLIGSLLRGFFEYFAQAGHIRNSPVRGFDWGREVLSLRTPGGLMTKQEKGWVGARTVTETTMETAPTNAVPSAEISPEASLDPDTETSKPTKQVVKKEETKEIRHRYLFAVEDPFELDHNVARTVTHNGICSIRDEFRRAWRIIQDIGRSNADMAEGLLDEVIEDDSKKPTLRELMESVHGKF